MNQSRNQNGNYIFELSDEENTTFTKQQEMTETIQKGKCINVNVCI